MIGERILNYTIQRSLGSGGTGQVYLAKHITLDRQVTIKVYPSNILEDYEVRKQFQEEAAAVSKLQHFNIATLYDYAEDSHGLCIIAEYVEGKPLNQLLKEQLQPINEKQVLPIFIQVVGGLAYAHSKKIIHQDLKPSNIVVCQDHTAKVLDFGIAHLLNASADKQNSSTRAKSSVIYYSPEQFQDAAVDHRSDIYTLGVLLYELLTGTPPYDTSKLSAEEIARRIQEEPLPPVVEKNPNVSVYLQEIIDKATAKNPADRYINALSMMEAVQRPIRYNTTKAIADKPAPPVKIITKKMSYSFRTRYVMSILAVAFITVVALLGLWWNPWATDKREARLNNTDGIDDIFLPSTDDTPANIEDNSPDKEEDDKEAKAAEKRKAQLDSLQTFITETENQIQTFNERRTKRLERALVSDLQILSNSLEGFKVRLSLVNTREDVAFEEVKVIVQFFDANNKAVAEHTEIFDQVKPGQKFSREISKNIDAETVNRRIDSFVLKDLDPPTLPDTLQAKKEKLQDAQDRLKKLQQEAN